MDARLARGGQLDWASPGAFAWLNGRVAKFEDRRGNYRASPGAFA